MVANQTTRATARPAPKAAPRRAPLKVVRPDDRARSVGIIGSTVAGFFFVVLFTLAGLHAVVVQTQAELDGVNSTISALEEQRINVLAERAWQDSPEGLSEAAAQSGLVPAAEMVMLAPVAPGALVSPYSIDPFSGGADG